MKKTGRTTSGLCRWCGATVGQMGSTGLCRACLDGHKGDYNQLKIPPTRHVATGAIRGCSVRVISDDRGRAESFLQSMRRCVA